MNKNLCKVEGCPNKDRYAKYCGHWEDEPKESKVDMKVYLRVRENYLKEHKTCEVNGCSRPAKEIHHRRGRLKNLLTDIRYFLAVCRPCHRWIEENPHAAKAEGLSESRHAKHAI